MKKIFSLILIIIIISFLGGCNFFEEEIEEHDLKVLAVNSEDNVIETAEIYIEDKEIKGEEGSLEVTLGSGEYEVIVEDTENKYTKTSRDILVTDNSTKTVNMFRNYSNVYIKALNEKENIIERAEFNVLDFEEKEGNKDNGIFEIPLKVGEKYTVEIDDPKKYYYSDEISFEVKENMDTLKKQLERVPEGSVTGELILPEKYHSTPLSYYYISIDDFEVTGNDDGFTLEDIPEGERTLEVDTVFGAEMEIDIEVDGNSVNNEEIVLPLDDFIDEELKDMWKYNRRVDGRGLVTYNDTNIARWKYDEINYVINICEDFKDDLNDPDYIQRRREEYREGIQALDNALAGAFSFNVVEDEEKAHLEIFAYYDHNSEIRGKTDGSVVTDDGKIKEFRVKVNINHASGEPAKTITAHEVGHSMGFGHSHNEEDVMYYSPFTQLSNFKEDMTREKQIFGLVYSMPPGTKNLFIEQPPDLD